MASFPANHLPGILPVAEKACYQQITGTHDTRRKHQREKIVNTFQLQQLHNLKSSKLNQIDFDLFFHGKSAFMILLSTEQQMRHNDKKS